MLSWNLGATPSWRDRCRSEVANGFEKTQAANILRREWGEPVIARGRTYMFDDCEIYLAGDMEGIAAVSHDGPPIHGTCGDQRFLPVERGGLSADRGHRRVRLRPRLRGDSANDNE